VTSKHGSDTSAPRPGPEYLNKVMLQYRSKKYKARKSLVKRANTVPSGEPVESKESVPFSLSLSLSLYISLSLSLSLSKHKNMEI